MIYLISSSFIFNFSCLIFVMSMHYVHASSNSKVVLTESETAT